MTLLDVLWPRQCGACDQPTDGALCARCARVQARSVPVDGLAGATALAAYRGGLGAAVLRAKGTGDRRLALAVARLAAPALATALADVDADALVPVPATPWRRMARGFDLPALVARELSPRVDLPVIHALRRIRDGRQAGLGRRARAQQAAGMFRQVRPTPARVVLVDDVVTTGATARACAVELLGGHAVVVHLATACAAGWGAPDAPAP